MVAAVNLLQIARQRVKIAGDSGCLYNKTTKNLFNKLAVYFYGRTKYYQHKV